MGRDPNVPDAGVGLWRPDVGLALGASDSLPDVHDTFREIQIAPAQAADLSGAEPTPARQEHRQTLTRRQFQQPVEFGW
jgi:hypothetical protein